MPPWPEFYELEKQASMLALAFSGPHGAACPILFDRPEREKTVPAEDVGGVQIYERHTCFMSFSFLLSVLVPA